MPWGSIPVLTAVLVVLAALPAGARTIDSPIDRFPHADIHAEVSDDFGVFVREHTHMGVDIFSKKGSPVVAVADGFVSRMSRGERSGYYIVIRHGDGWESFYLHLNDDTRGTDNGRGGRSTAFAADVGVGDFVEAGQVIGYVGDSGNAESTSAHTHFELHRNGRAVDPYHHIEQARERRLLEIQIEAGETPFR